MIGNIKNVIIIPICGFANRLRFINSCVYLFKQYDIIPSIHWKTTEECNIDHLEIFKELSGLEFVSKIPKDVIYYSHIHLAYVIEQLGKLSGESRNINTLVVTGGHEYRPPNTSELKFIAVKNQFYKKIEWTEYINNEVSKIKKNLGIEDNNYITVHYRSLDNRFDSKDLKNSDNINFNDNSPLKEFKRYIEQISDTKIVLISNSQDINIDNVLRISDKDCDRNNKDSMIQSIVEFNIMCDSKLIIGSYFSSFSDEAAFFNIIPKIIPIDISKIKNNISYHCSGLSFNSGILCLNHSSQKIIDCIKFKN
jgi:hypothetical protein